MKKTVAILLVAVLTVAFFTACGSTPATSSSTPASSAASSVASSSASSAAPVENAEIVDGKFVKERSIKVTIYDRSNDGGTKPDDNVYTDYIKENVKNDLNINVTFDPIPRWTEGDVLNSRLAAGDAPDVCITYSGPTITTYAQMGAVHELSAMLDDNKELLSNLWDFLGEELLYWNKNPKTGEIFSIVGRRTNLARINTFVREDWLKKLNIPEPKTRDEFEAMLYSFKDNAEVLLGADASRMIPLTMGTYVTWNADPLLQSYIPDNMTDKDKYILGFNGNTLYPGMKDGIKKLNEWFNAGLIWQEFAIATGDDQTNTMKAGYVGAAMQNWDNVYRGGENGIHNTLIQNLGEGSSYIAIEPFIDDQSGVPSKGLYDANDRNIFLPHTNKEPLASLMYIDWMTAYDNVFYLQYGDEGVSHEILPDGAVKYISTQAPTIMNSPNNLDYTLTINGPVMKDADIFAKSLALGYGFVDQSYIVRAYDVAMNYGTNNARVNVGVIDAEAGMGPALTEKRDTFQTQAINAPLAQFDAVYDAGLADYLTSGGQAVVDERTIKWAEFFGDSDWVK